MSYVVNSLPDYVEQNNFPLLRRSVFGAKTASLFEVQTGVKSSAALNIIENNITFQDDSCSRSPSGTSTFTQRKIEVGKIAVHMDFCPKDLEAKYTQTRVKAGSNQDELPFEEIFTADIADQIARNLEIAIWQGDTQSGNPNLNKFDGILAHLDDAGNYIDGNPSDIEEITAANVEDVVDAVYLAIPAEIVTESDVAIMMGTDVFRTYAKALRDSNLFHYDGEATNFELVLPGTNVRLYGLNGLNGTDTIVAGRLSNFYVGVDLEDEEEDFELWYSKDDRVMKFTSAFKYGTQVAFPDEVVLWEPDAS